MMAVVDFSSIIYTMVGFKDKESLHDKHAARV